MELNFYWAKKFTEDAGVVPTQYIEELCVDTQTERLSKYASDTDHLGREPIKDRVTKMLEFIDLVRANYPYLSIGIERNIKGVFSGLYTGRNDSLEVYLYIPRFSLTMGKIGFGRFLEKDIKMADSHYPFERDRAEFRFAVWSPHIKNERYNENTSQHHMKASPDMYKAIKHVKFARPVVSANYIEAFYSSLFDRYDSALAKYDEEVSRAKREISNDNLWFTELRNVYLHAKNFPDNKAYQLDPKLVEKFDTLEKDIANYREMRELVSPNLLQVRVLNSGTGIEVTPIECMFGKNGTTQQSIRYCRKVDIGELMTYNADYIPTKIQGQISTLDLQLEIDDREKRSRRPLDSKNSFMLGVGWVALDKELYYVYA